jgi:hypothetical protein
MLKGNAFRRLAAIAGVMVASVTFVTPAGAQTQTPAPEVFFVSPVAFSNPLQPDVAYVIGIYRCYGGEPIHLWVSLKQGGPDPTAEGSGATSTSWYDTNILAPPPVTCDGSLRSVVVPVGKYPNKARLTSGQAWVQFCLVSNEGIVASQQKFIRVIAF